MNKNTIVERIKITVVMKFDLIPATKVTALYKASNTKDDSNSQ
jgi:hypothetical protein